MFPSPYMTLNCTGTRRGSECSFACIEHAKVVGKRNTVCRRDGDLPYAEWVMDFHPYCEREFNRLYNLICVIIINQTNARIH